MANQITATIKLCSVSGSIHRVVIADRTVEALNDVSKQVFSTVLEFSYVNAEGERIVISKDTQLVEAIESARGVLKLNVAVQEAAAVATEVPVGATDAKDAKRSSRWMARAQSMPKWRLQKMLDRKSRKMDECTDEASRVKLGNIVEQLKEAIENSPTEDACERREERWKGKLNRMPRFRLEKVLERKIQQLEKSSPGPRADRLATAVAAIKNELATKVDTEGSGSKSRGKSGRCMNKLGSLPRFRLQKMLERKEQMLANCSDYRSERISKMVVAIKKELEERGDEEVEKRESKRGSRKARKCGSRKCGSRKRGSCKRKGEVA